MVIKPNRRQKITLRVFAVVLMIALSFPPYARILGDGVKVNEGVSFILLPILDALGIWTQFFWDSRATIDVSVLLTEVLIITLVGLAVYLSQCDNKENSE